MLTKAVFLLGVIAASSYALIPVSAIGEEIAMKCHDVYCTTVACNPGEQKVFHPGDCCPSCEAVLYEEAIRASNKPKYCSRVQCVEPMCGPGITPVVNPRECCAVCPEGEGTRQACIFNMYPSTLTSEVICMHCIEQYCIQICPIHT